MFDTILLPIDPHHAESWEKALPVALHLCGDSGTLHVLGIVHDLGAAASVASFLPADFEKSALQKMGADMDAFVAANVPAGRTAVVHVAYGHVPQRILSAAEEIGAGLIVMASQPPDELVTLLVGSNAGRVVRHARQSVLVVR
ncbi:universal stress protein [Tropicibacter sp. S64]|uniref:universal stress protein n=1 Tax=Tropicibacter sp. S64 TaxID=3415122 RepID=UPI003C7D1842